ncbi:SCY1-like protein 2 [Branchiostoma floridae]|uniref:SCY1-like protein 2 n=1 Tax=Branchiostoma floridae TaxID=7739 RepID=A0A9J7L283_BRAFL|nr:SCY1-like protein 2 [Branchiostoma floridae]
MEMLKKLQSTVQSTVSSAASSVLGNPVTREFEIRNHVASGGPGCLWKIYNGIKKTTKQEVSVFVCEKRQFERMNRRDRDAVIEAMKRGVTQLTRLRHPRLLTVQHPLEESRDSLAFATEPVFASLANVLGNYENMPTPVPAAIKDHQLYEVEIKYGLLQVTEGLAFLHNDVKMVHGNLTPEVIILNKNGAWKVAGFEFCIPSSNPPDQAAFFSAKEYDENLTPLAQQTLNYHAPEYVLQCSCDTPGDLFSLGMLFYAIFNQGKTIMDCGSSLLTYKRNIEQLGSLRMSVLGSVPDPVRECVKLMLNVEPTVRPDADQMSKIPFFDDVGAMTLQYLDTLLQRDNLQKSQFFKGLPKVMSKLPKRVLLQRVLPCLTQEFVNPDMIPFVLPNVLLISDDCSNEEYTRLVLPQLKPVFKVTEPVQIVVILLQKMDLLLSKTPAQDVKDHVLPMVYRAMESSMQPIQERCLAIIPTFSSMVDFSTMKHSIIPRIKTMCLQTSSLSVRVNCLVCLGKMLESLDKWFVLDEILPMLQEIPSREPAVLMGMLGIYKMTLEHKKLGIPRDVLATKVLPFLLPIVIDNGLNLKQFNAFMSVIKEMVRQVEQEQRTKLEQLHSMQEEQQRSSLAFTQVSSDDNKGTNSMFAGGGGGGEQQNGGSDSMMDKIWSSFGLGGSKPVAKEPVAASMSGSPAASMRSSSSSLVDREEPAVSLDMSPGRMPNQPAKVNLTLEEKQRLARDQEQQRRLKTQGPIAPQAAKPTSSSPKPRDLSKTLLDSKPMVPPSTGMMGSSQGMMGGSTCWSMMGSTTTTSMGMMGMTSTSSGMMGSGPTQSMMGMSSQGMMGMSSQGMMGTGGQGMMGKMGNQGMIGGTTGASGFQGQTQAKPDLSSLDNLFGPPKQKVPMGQMTSSQQQPMGFSPLGGTNTGGMGGWPPPDISQQQQQQKPAQNLSRGDIMDFLG